MNLRAMPTSTTFVQPFLSSWSRQGVINEHRNRILDASHHARNISCPKRSSASRTVVSSSLISRPFLLSNRKPAQSESVKDEPTSQGNQNIPVLRRTGMNTPMVLSKDMQQFIGHDMMTRSQVVAQLGKYIKEKNLYVEGDRKRFVVDQFLSRLLQVDGDHPILALQKLVSKHLIQPSEMGPEYQERANRLFQNYLKERGAVDSKLVPRRRDPRGFNSLKTQQELRAKGMGMYSDVVIDPCLRPICGGRDRMSRPQVLKAVWNYIKSKELQDPENRRNIIVDDGLKHGLQITDVATIDCFHVGRYLWKLCKDPRSK